MNVTASTFSPLEDAQNLLRRGNFSGALEAVQAGIEADPENAVLHNMLGIIHSHAGKWEDAQAAFEQAIDFNDQDANCWNNLGEACREQGKWEDAALAFNAALGRQPNHAAVLANLGLLALQKRKVKEAEAFAKQALAVDPQGRAANRLKAAIHLRHGKLKEADEALAELLSHTPHYAEALLLKAQLRQMQGRLDEAAGLAQQLREQHPHMAEVKLRQAAVLVAQKKPGEALQEAQEAVAQKPFLPEAHVTLGNVYLAGRQVDKALQAFDAAIALEPNYAIAHTCRAAALLKLSRVAEAEAAIDKAQTLEPGQPQHVVARASLEVSMGKKAEAEARLLTIIAQHPHYVPALHSLVSILLSEERVAEMEPFLKVILEQEPTHVDAMVRMGWVHYERYEHAIAASYLAAGLYRNPEMERVRQSYVYCLRCTALTNYSREHANAVMVCLKDPQLSKTYLSNAWYALLNMHPELGLVNQLLGLPSYEEKAKLLDQIRQDELFRHPFFLTGLEKLIMARVKYEIFTMAVRRYALEHRKAVAGWGWGPFLTALASHHHLAEYVSDELQEETKSVDALCTELHAQSPIEDILIAACYRWIWKLPQAEELSKRLHESDMEWLKEIAHVHIDERLEERRILPTIQTLGEVTDMVSQAVQNQYEENPYPRWQFATQAKPKPFAEVVKTEFPYLKPEKIETSNPLKILIAGCGTGMQVAQSKSLFSNAEMLAVDLSRSSLAYAIRSAREYKLENVTFRQADILKLADELTEKYDYIECSGVLHHMREPEKGLEVLCKLLKPTGFMKLGLYSEIARKRVVETRQFIAEQGYPTTPEGIRTCRKAVFSLPQDHPVRKITDTRDFYSLSECRDLIFHVQEHRFTLLQIKEMLNRHGIEFVGFSGIPALAFRDYKKEFPEDPHFTNLENWHRFEERYPIVFIGMYQFWVRPKQK